MRGLTILKLGSSVLTGESALRRAASAVSKGSRNGRLLVVVSALAGETDRLLGRVAALATAKGGEEAIAAWVATGESIAAARFAVALAELGEPAAVLDPRRTLRIDGPRLDGAAVDVDRAEIDLAFGRARFAVLPGFFGESVEGGAALLGRGGSDLTALFLAEHLAHNPADPPAAVDCQLIKDVDGIFERDPATAGRPPARFRTLDWSVASRIAGRLVQPKALAFAAERRIPFSVGALGGDGGTLVGDLPTTFAGQRAEVCA